jgi:hypothetical protein
MERIALYSRGIPRSINVISENALLRAWKSSARQVTAEMVEQVVKELRLPPASAPRTGATAGCTPTADSRPENLDVPPPPRRRDDVRRPVSIYDFDLVEQEMSSHQPAIARGRAAVALSIGVWLTAFAVALTGLFLYNGYNGSALLAPRSTLDAGAPPRFLEPSRLSDTPGMPLERPVVPPVKLSPVQSPVALHAESAAVERPRDDRTNASNIQRRAREESGGAARASTSPARLSPADAGEDKRDSPKPARKAPVPRTYTVVGASFVRETPRSDAEITTTLPPGARVQVLGKAGEYFRVRGLDGETATGYVHQEDAFFEPSK